MSVRISASASPTTSSTLPARPGGTCCGDSDWDDKTEDEINAAYDAGSVKFAKGCAFVVAAMTLIAVIITLIAMVTVVTMVGAIAVLLRAGGVLAITTATM